MDCFFKGDDIKGESSDAKHKGEIDVLSWSWGAQQAGSSQSGGGTGTGKVNVHDLTFTKYVDRSSPVLFTMCCAGTPIAKSVLVVRKAGDKPLEYLKFTMTQAIITSLTMGGDGGTERLVETISLNFATVKHEYVPQKADGTGDATVSGGWDIAGNTKL